MDKKEVTWLALLWACFAACVVLMGFLAPFYLFAWSEAPSVWHRLLVTAFAAGALVVVTAGFGLSGRHLFLEANIGWLTRKAEFKDEASSDLMHLLEKKPRMERWKFLRRYHVRNFRVRRMVAVMMVTTCLCVGQLSLALYLARQDGKFAASPTVWVALVALCVIAASATVYYVRMGRIRQVRVISSSR